MSGKTIAKTSVFFGKRTIVQAIFGKRTIVVIERKRGGCTTRKSYE